MVDARSVHTQLKRIKFSANAWGRAEVKELPGILSPDEKIYECVNGTYEGGFALLVSTDMRVLLIDKKPLNFLTVEDLRFDMINQIDYNHRLMGATIIINTGYKTLKFTSWNQDRLRKLITHVQDRMSEIKKEAAEHQENQKQHLAAINQQLQAYLLAQHQQLMQFQQQKAQDPNAQLQPVKPSPELSDYLFAQSLLTQFAGRSNDTKLEPSRPEPAGEEKSEQPSPKAEVREKATASPASPSELYSEGYQEIFGKAARPQQMSRASDTSTMATAQITDTQGLSRSLEVNPLKIAYSKLPMMLRNRKFGRPSLHAHSQSSVPTQPAISQPAPQA